jgi:hypothetical protein
MKFIKITDQYGEMLYINLDYITDVRTIRHLGEDGVRVNWKNGYASLFGSRAVEFMLAFNSMIE